MNMRHVLAVSFLFVGSPAVANQVVLEANGARAEGRWGLELGGGYQFDLGPIALRPLAGALIHGDPDSQFQSETFDNGQTVCRDTANGQFVGRSNCGPAVRAYGKVEAVARIPFFGEIGAGARFSADAPRIYGTAAASVLPGVRIKGNIGDRYYALGIMAGF